MHLFWWWCVFLSSASRLVRCNPVTSKLPSDHCGFEPSDCDGYESELDNSNEPRSITNGQPEWSPTRESQLPLFRPLDKNAPLIPTYAQYSTCYPSRAHAMCYDPSLARDLSVDSCWRILHVFQRVRKHFIRTMRADPSTFHKYAWVNLPRGVEANFWTWTNQCIFAIYVVIDRLEFVPMDNPSSIEHYLDTIEILRRRAYPEEFACDACQEMDNDSTTFTLSEQETCRPALNMELVQSGVPQRLTKKEAEALTTIALNLIYEQFCTPKHRPKSFLRQFRWKNWREHVPTRVSYWNGYELAEIFNVLNGIGIEFESLTRRYESPAKSKVDAAYHAAYKKLKARFEAETGCRGEIDWELVNLGQIPYEYNIRCMSNRTLAWFGVSTNSNIIDNIHFIRPGGPKPAKPRRLGEKVFTTQNTGSVRTLKRKPCDDSSII